VSITVNPEPVILPAITSFSPISGVVGSEVTATGSNFTDITVVSFNGTAATEFVVDSATQLHATVPEGATSGPISVSNAKGSSTSAENFTVLPTPPINQPPTVVAAGDPVVTLPNSVVLTGTITDDGLPSNVLTMTWSKIDGPGNVTFANTAAADTTATFSAAGTYVLRLEAGDGVLTASDDVTITVNQPPNPLPVITLFSPISGEVGSEVVVTGLNFVDVAGVSFNGIAASEFAVDSATQLRATVPAGATSGPIRVTNAKGSGTSTQSFTVLTIEPTNEAPSVVAGGDQVVTLPNSAILTGTVSDDGLPNNHVTTTWRKIDGPGDVIFADASAVNTYVTFSVPGSYVLRLEANDDLLTAFDDVSIFVRQAAHFLPAISAFSPTSGEAGTRVTITGTNFMSVTAVSFNGTAAVEIMVDSATRLRATVPEGATSGPLSINTANGSGTSAQSFTVLPTKPTNQPNHAPTVVASGDQVVILPNGATLTGTVNDDGLPKNHVTTHWSKISGPGDVIFADVEAINTTAAFSAAGIYVLRLEVSDSALSAFADVTIHVYKPAMFLPAIGSLNRAIGGDR
jgi:hypothetical protein